MAIATTSSFNPDVGDIIEEAFECAGLEARSGYDLRTARRSLNLLMLEWQNKGLNLWMVEEVRVDKDSAGVSLTTNFLNKGTASYQVDIGTISILDIVLRMNDADVSTQVDYNLSRISEPNYAAIPNKLSQGRPIQYYFDRKEIQDTGAATDQNSTLTLWPVPDENSKYKIIYWRLKRIADVGNDASNTMEVPDRFLPALIAGLAYKIAMKRPEASHLVANLKMNYDELFTEAAEEDRVKTSARFVPRVMGY